MPGRVGCVAFAKLSQRRLLRGADEASRIGFVTRPGDFCASLDGEAISLLMDFVLRLSLGDGK